MALPEVCERVLLGWARGGFGCSNGRSRDLGEARLRSWETVGGDGALPGPAGRDSNTSKPGDISLAYAMIGVQAVVVMDSSGRSILPFGSWPTPITSEFVVRASARLGGVWMD